MLVLTAVLLLITGSKLLVVPVCERHHLPLGTIITWLGLVALPLSILASSENLWNKRSFGKWYAFALKLCITLSLCWGFISYLLSGKWNFTFSGSSPTYVGSGEAGEHFWMITYTIAALPLFVGLLFSVHLLVSRINSSPK
jgi:hypothetical protein